MPYKNKEQNLTAQRRAYARNRLNSDWMKRRSLKCRERYRSNPESYKLRARKNYAARYRKHSGTCPLCGFNGKLVWDHDHLTGLFRAWICRQCNLLLGHAKDNIQTLQNCINYLEEHGRRESIEDNS